MMIDHDWHQEALSDSSFGLGGSLVDHVSVIGETLAPRRLSNLRLLMRCQTPPAPRHDLGCALEVVDVDSVGRGDIPDALEVASAALGVEKHRGELPVPTGRYGRDGDAVW